MAGLDDNWQACNKGVNGSFFGPDGSPLINTDLFPDMKQMVAYGHSKGVKMGWYFNNCICKAKTPRLPSRLFHPLRLCTV
jgi:hypothetical protein